MDSKRRVGRPLRSASICARVAHQTALARRENISINQFISTALAEKLSALLTEEYLEERAQRGDRKKHLRALDKVKVGEPEPGDEF